MQFKRILILFFISLIFLFLYLLLIPNELNISYAGTLSSDINGIDESRYPGYKNLINNLKANHPNYSFQVYYTGIDWNSAIVSEYQSHGTSPKNIIRKTTKKSMVPVERFSKPIKKHIGKVIPRIHLKACLSAPFSRWKNRGSQDPFSP